MPALRTRHIVGGSEGFRSLACRAVEGKKQEGRAVLGQQDQRTDPPYVMLRLSEEQRLVEVGGGRVLGAVIILKRHQDAGMKTQTRGELH